MRDFAYVIAKTPEDAVVADGTNIMPIAGGTELLNWFRLGIAAPTSVIDLGHIPGLGTIAQTDDWLSIGALASLNDVGAHAVVRSEAALLSQACLAAASAQIRNRATIGGNVLQKTRCAYFRTEAPVPWACNKREPGSGCAAYAGLNERHALFGWTDDCVATQPSDPVVALAALEAEVELAGRDGRRILPVTELHLTQEDALAAGLDPARTETRMKPGEIIVGYRVPIRKGQRSAYVKVRERASYEYALVSAGAVIELDGGKISRASIALGSVAQKPWRLVKAEHELVGLPPTREAVLPALRAALADARPLSQNRYKISMAAGAAARAIVEASA
ncbi:carbon monoxide dehydrogenase [Rhizobium sp. Leaf391]|uniref:FAD binding domain-containing protein n=1 Tax=Rhizobium sp. Leaf391 TaxID=1736360 RepID=UPI0007124CDC|nr:FAD binding domain-containing protein [Rhizobium sp. Leaf391]KQT02883.1 carbon monoxide dehydrogenase [Rhizobium sp. Leaf391]